jgi:hypothetical protein
VEKNDPEGTLVAGLTTYFDGAGKHHQTRNQVVSVAGFLASEERWLQFEPRWREVLGDAGVTEFHMTDLVNSKRQYAGWNNQQAKREKFLADLCGIVIDTIEFSVGSGVVLEAWDLVNLNYQLEECDFQPYRLCGWSCIQRLKDWFDKKGLDFSQAVFLFEHGEEHQENLRRRVEKDFGITIQTETKKISQLQAADFASWQLLNMMRQYELGLAQRDAFEPWILQEFARLFGKHRTDYFDHSHFSMDHYGPRSPSLLRLCTEYSVPYRR